MVQQHVINQESGAASAALNTSDESTLAPDIASSAEAPVNTESSSQADVAIAPIEQSSPK